MAMDSDSGSWELVTGPDFQVGQALAVIENVWKVSSSVLVNKHQCKRIADRFNTVGEGLKCLRSDITYVGNEASDGGGSRSSKEYPAFDELLTVLRKGEMLVSYYEESKGITSVLSRTDNREAFKEIHDELDTMKAQFDFEGLSEAGVDKDFESTSGYGGSHMLTTDADKDLEEMRKILASLEGSEQTSGLDMGKVTQVVLEKSEHGGSSDKLPSYLEIDPRTIEIQEPVRNPERNSKRDPVEEDGWALVRFGKWLGCDFAIKVFESRAVDGTGWNTKQLLMEVGSLEELRHPHIVRLVGFGRDDDRCVFLMELMDGDLRDYMRKKLRAAPKVRPFTRSEELDIITQIAKGMYYLHTQGYAHGDLKCSNILVKQFEKYLEVKISDLRGSQKLGKDWDPEAFEQACLTRRPRWTAPEAIDRYGGIEPSEDLLKKSDVYSFGMTCYEVVTGKYPFDGIKDDELLEQIKAGIKPELPGELSEDLKGLIKECWHHDPTKRPDFANICVVLEFIRSTKSAVGTSRSSGKDVVLSLFKRVPQVHGVVRWLGLVRQGKEQVSDASATESSTWGEMNVGALPRSNSAISVPKYLRISPSELKKVRLIGKGASAKVYEATWLGCTFAVKRFKAISSTQVLQQEVDFLIKLSRHPYIAQMVGLSVDAKEQCSIVMEYMSGSLEELIQYRRRKRSPATKETEKGLLDCVVVPFDLPEAVRIITKIALGMAYLHSKGVVHRDLKSGNVLAVEHPGSIDVKIVDFGMSQHEQIGESSEIQGFFVGVGTGFWRAPEILPAETADRSKMPDLKATDVYSFAMTCFEVLTGRVPFSDLGRTEYAKVIAGHRPTLPSDLHPELKALIEKCWHKDPAKRPNFTEICEELQRIQQTLRSSSNS